MSESIDMAAAQERYAASCESNRPSTIYKPRLYIDGDKWCALYGENIQDGVAGFGSSPDGACRAFDSAWYAELPCKATTKTFGTYTPDECRILNDWLWGDGDTYYDSLPQTLQEKVGETMADCMPYGTQRARTGDPAQWIDDNIDQVRARYDALTVVTLKKGDSR